MTSRFLTKVLYTAQMENSAFERKIEQLVFEALTYTDCEAAIYKYMESVTRAEFTIMKIDRFQIDSYHDLSFNYHEDFSNDSLYFLFKAKWITVEDIEVKEKILIKAKSIDEARRFFEDSPKNKFSFLSISLISETKITDYIYAETD